jgi:hypothetical protein
MLKHFVLNLNPHGQFEWERCALQHPITAEQPDFALLLATDIRRQTSGLPHSGSYLIAVNIEVTVLESNVTEAHPLPHPLPQSLANPLTPPGTGIAPRLSRTLEDLRSVTDHRTPVLAEVA